MTFIHCFTLPFFTYVHLSLCSHFLFCLHFRPCAHSLPHLCSRLIHAHYFFILIDPFAHFHLSLLVPSTCFPVLTLVARAYFWLDANSMLSSHLFTSSSCHIFKCFPRTLFASCTVIILCALFAFIDIFSSFMHLLYSYLALASFFLFCPYSVHFSFFFFPVYLHIAILLHLISCASWSTIYSFAHLSTCHLLSPFLPCYIPWFSFHQFHILFTFATLLSYTSPPPCFTCTSFIVTISSLFYSPLNFISHFFPLISLHLHFLSFSFYIFGTTYVWPFSVLLWLIIEDFCSL